MSKFECPFKDNPNVCCGYGGMTPVEGVIECPTEIFNQCQSDGEEEEDGSL